MFKSEDSKMEPVGSLANAMLNGPKKINRISVDEVPAVKCFICGKLHEVKQTLDGNSEYISIMVNW